MKYLLVLGVVLFAVWLWRHNRAADARAQAEERARRTPPSSPAPAPVLVADMVACAHCGLHVPTGEAIAHQGAFYCSDAHRRAHQA